jgi:hypothetical protein
MLTDAFTEKLIELSSGVITKTGACARVTEGSTTDAKRQRIVNWDFQCGSTSPLPRGVEQANHEVAQLVHSFRQVERKSTDDEDLVLSRLDDPPHLAISVPSGQIVF